MAVSVAPTSPRDNSGVRSAGADHPTRASGPSRGLGAWAGWLATEGDFFRSIDLAMRHLTAGSSIFQVRGTDCEGEDFTRWMHAPIDATSEQVLERAQAHYYDATIHTVDEEQCKEISALVLKLRREARHEATAVRVRCRCGDGSCMLCDDDGMLPIGDA